jgi:hypothetical protein
MDVWMDGWMDVLFHIDSSATLDGFNDFWDQFNIKFNSIQFHIKDFFFFFFSLDLMISEINLIQFHVLKIN